VSDVGGHQAVFEDFIRAIMHDSMPACEGKQGRRSLELIEAIYRAARSPANDQQIVSRPSGAFDHS
jgi:hypothetical protein